MTQVIKARRGSWLWRKKTKRIITLSGISLLVLIGLLIVISYRQEEGVHRGTEQQLAAYVEPEYEESNEYPISDVAKDMPEPELASPLEQSEIEISEFLEDDVIDVITTLSNSEALSYLALVNRNFRLSSDFSPSDLSVVSALNTYGNINQWITMRETAARALESMLATAHEEGGHVIIIISGYRSYTTQTAVHDNAIINYGESEALRLSAFPGHSEHQLGLAMDISTFSLGGQLSTEFSSTPEGIWVRNNAHRFGFIIRYPQDREAETGFTYEPWHLRYIGVDPATQIFNNGMILEEFLESN